ncbi:cobyric acid synthase [Striga asiatica]|uniref:Cobyric acid synthase n=1 Tax=Striga asiatica TaxID=4170 RepID=A0A5A7QKS4_STRAF|nr:cobyric acid synthase [Striga asiatica]
MNSRTNKSELPSSSMASKALSFISFAVTLSSLLFTISSLILSAISFRPTSFSPIQPQSLSQIPNPTFSTTSAFTRWSPCCGQASTGTPSRAASTTEFHPQWLTNPPTAGCAKMRSWSTHPLTTIPLPSNSILLRKDSPSRSSGFPASSLSTLLDLRTHRNLGPLISSPWASSRSGSRPEADEDDRAVGLSVKPRDIVLSRPGLEWLERPDGKDFLGRPVFGQGPDSIVFEPGEGVDEDGFDVSQRRVVGGNGGPEEVAFVQHRRWNVGNWHGADSRNLYHVLAVVEVREMVGEGEGDESCGGGE